MSGVDDLEGVLEQFKQAGNEFVKGNPKPVQELFSHRDDVTLANPFGPPARGWEEVAEAQERGAAVFRDGEVWDSRPWPSMRPPSSPVSCGSSGPTRRWAGLMRSPPATLGSRWPFDPKTESGRWSTATP